ncbi:MAG TPA: DUF6152 family protein [Gammaproteobacteria bacterium]|jgi:hypothetical protein|nr:DUF6152 family protein [Gammaproteobacteria bacterium]
MKLRYGSATALACLALCTAQAYAHHSVTANFDPSREIEIRGAVVAFNYVSPHASMVIDGIGYENGQALSTTPERWEIESSAVKGLAARGIKADTFAVGEQIIVRGAPARNTALHRANSSTFLHADGTPFGSAPAPAAPVAAPAATGVKRVEGRWIPPYQPEGKTSTLPLNAAGQAAWNAYVQADSPANTCEPMSIPDIMNAPSYLFDVRFGDGKVVLRNEAYDIVRTVPLGKDFAQVDPNGTWGKARAEIDGNALYVESKDYPASKWGLAAATQILGGGADVPSSTKKTVVEKLTVSDDGLQLFYDYVVFDPMYMTHEHRAHVTLKRTADDAPMVPYDCNKNSARQFSRAAGESLLPAQ